MECNNPNDYCFNLKYLAWQNRLSEMYRLTNPSTECFADKITCPPATGMREGIDGWPATNASATLDSITTGIGITMHPTEPNGKKVTAIYQATIDNNTFTAPKDTRYLINYKNLAYNVDISLYNMSTAFVVPIQDIKGATIIRYENIVRVN